MFSLIQLACAASLFVAGMPLVASLCFLGACVAWVVSCPTVKDGGK
jgi:hypothetical protein